MYNVKRLLNLEGFLIYLFYIRTFHTNSRRLKKLNKKCLGVKVELCICVLLFKPTIVVFMCKAVVVFTLMAKI